MSPVCCLGKQATGVRDQALRRQMCSPSLHVAVSLSVHYLFQPPNQDDNEKTSITHQPLNSSFWNTLYNAGSPGGWGGKIIDCVGDLKELTWGVELCTCLNVPLASSMIDQWPCFSVVSRCCSYGRVYATADPYHHTIGPAATYSVGTMVSVLTAPPIPCLHPSSNNIMTPARTHSKKIKARDRQRSPVFIHVIFSLIDLFCFVFVMLSGTP